MSERYKGKLLVAKPLLGDPNFHRTVVLLLEHGPAVGALGLVLTQPTELHVAEAVEGWEDLAAGPSVVFIGGPVAAGSAICLGTVREGVEADEDAFVVGRLAPVDLTRDPALVATEVEAVRIFSGYSGWAAGQLEFELAQDSWFIADAQPSDALTGAPSGLWEDVLRRQGGAVAQAADVPPEPWLN